MSVDREMVTVRMEKTFFGSPENARHGYEGVAEDVGPYNRVEVILVYISQHIEAVEVMINRKVTALTISESTANAEILQDFLHMMGECTTYRSWQHASGGGKHSIIDDLAQRFGIELDFSQV